MCRRFKDTGYSITKCKTAATSDVFLFFIKTKSVTPQIKYKKAQELSNNAEDHKQRRELSQGTQNINKNV